MSGDAGREKPAENLIVNWWEGFIAVSCSRILLRAWLRHIEIQVRCRIRYSHQCWSVTFAMAVCSTPRSLSTSIPFYRPAIQPQFRAMPYKRCRLPQATRDKHGVETTGIWSSSRDNRRTPPRTVPQHLVLRRDLTREPGRPCGPLFDVDEHVLNQAGEVGVVALPTDVISVFTTGDGILRLRSATYSSRIAPRTADSMSGEIVAIP
jgi:hypothetical protein